MYGPIVFGVIAGLIVILVRPEWAKRKETERLLYIVGLICLILMGWLFSEPRTLTGLYLGITVLGFFCGCTVVFVYRMYHDIRADFAETPASEAPKVDAAPPPQPTATPAPISNQSSVDDRIASLLDRNRR